MEEKRVRLITLPTLDQLAEFPLPIKGVHLAAFTPDGKSASSNSRRRQSPRVGGVLNCPLSLRERGGGEGLNTPAIPAPQPVIPAQAGI